jgi:hypothetical protein
LDDQVGLCIYYIDFKSISVFCDWLSAGKCAARYTLQHDPAEEITITLIA